MFAGQTAEAGMLVGQTAGVVRQAYWFVKQLG